MNDNTVQGEISTLPAPQARTAVAMTAGHTVVAIVPQTFEEYYRYAVMAFKSGMLPWDCKTAENAMARLLHGAELGLKPMQSLQSIAVINGRPSVWGDAALAICLEVLDSFEESLSTDPAEGMVYTATATRTIGKRTRTVTQTYSEADAKTAKLWGKKNKNKNGDLVDSPWVTNPKRMLQMRARGFCLRDICPDMLKGMHLKEEIDDLPPEEQQQTLRQVTTGQTVAQETQREEIDPPSPPAVDGEIVQDHVEISSQETDDSPPSPSSDKDAPPSPDDDDRVPSADEGQAAQHPAPPQEDAAPPSPTPPPKTKATRGPKSGKGKAAEPAKDPAQIDAFDEDPPDPKHAEDFYKFVEAKLKAVPRDAGEEGLLEVWTKYVNKREIRTKILPPDMSMLGDLYGRYQAAMGGE